MIFYHFINGEYYIHWLLALCGCLVASWIPSLLRGLCRLLSPLFRALASLIGFKRF